MVLGIDASNIRAGGGVTHLIELLHTAKPADYGFSKVIIWASLTTLRLIEDRPWLVKRNEPALEKHFFRRAIWQRNRLGELAKAEGCNLLFVPGGSFVTTFRPVVTMSRNMLPFEWRELLRFGVSKTTLRLSLLRRVQSASFSKANGTIFLTRYARDAVLKVTGALPGKTTVIPHGVDERFLNRPREQRLIEGRSIANPIRLIYVSIINVYKHQAHVVEAIANLRAKGFPVTLDLVGSAYPPELRKLRKVIKRVDPTGTFVEHHGVIPYHELHSHYVSADICIFASSCENMPNILLEGMASGLPIACSERGPMPEVLGNAGIYFNPEEPVSIASALELLIVSPRLRIQKAQAAFDRAQKYSWQRCADETFSFLSEIQAQYD